MRTATSRCGKGIAKPALRSAYHARESAASRDWPTLAQSRVKKRRSYSIAESPKRETRTSAGGHAATPSAAEIAARRTSFTSAGGWA